MDIRIILKADSPIVITGPEIRLGELAILTCANYADCDAMRELDVGRSPRAGRVRVITMDELQRIVRRLEPRMASRADWSGQETLEIRADKQNYDVKAIEKIAEERLAQWLNDQRISVEMQIVTKLKMLSLPVGEVSLTAKVSPAARLSKRMPVWVEVAIDGQIYQTVTIWFSVTAEQNAWVLVAPVEQRTALTPSMVQSARVDIATLSAPPLSTIPEGSLRARRRMEVGAILTESDVELLPAVIAGDQVTVVVREGSVALSLVGVAEADADLHEHLKVRNPGSGQLYSATVVAPKTVRAH